MMMKRFENGDILLSENEYRELTSQKSRDHLELANRFIAHNKFYWNLKNAQFDLSSITNFDPNKIPEIRSCYIREKDLELFKEWSKLIREFDPDRPL